MFRGSLPAIRVAAAAAAVAAAAALARTHGAPPTVVSSVPAQAPHAVHGAAIEFAPLSHLAIGDQATVDRLPLDDGTIVDLRLRRFDILAPGARLVTAGAGGEQEMDASAVVLLRGTVAGDPASRVFLGVSPFGTHGFVRHDGALHVVSTGPHSADAGDDFTLRVTDASALAPLGDQAPSCGTTADSDHLLPNGLPDTGGGDGSGGAITGSPCRVARLAIETDWEFTANLFGGNTGASSAYALTLVAAVSEIFQGDLNTRLLVTYLRVWSADDDPYSPGDGDLLQQFRSHWTANESGIEREAAHMLSGRNDLPYGGVAYVSVICDPAWGFGLSGYLGGSFPYPLQDNHGGNWDLVVVAHELGHNFGTLHTHDGYEPPIDNCGNDDCTDAANGTIMSYCHTCAGGMTNIALSFHPLVRGVILAYLDGNGCDITAGGVAAIPDQFVTYQGVSATLDILLNDLAASCDPVALGEFDATSFHGAAITLVPADEMVPRDRLLYSPPAMVPGEDSFHYSLVGGESALVHVVVPPLREPDIVGAVEPGAAARYYELAAPSSLPDFDALSPYAEDVVPDVAYASTGGLFATSGRADEVGAVFTGFVTVPENGPYTFFTNSDDGSALYIGDQLVVNNDGLHGMVERSGEIGLAAGPHAVRVEFFENGGGAGLIVSVEGPDMAKQPIPASSWTHALPCAADFNGNGAIDFQDLLEILMAWGPCAACPEDIDQNGEVGFADLLVLLTSWGDCD